MKDNEIFYKNTEIYEIENSNDFKNIDDDNKTTNDEESKKSEQSIKEFSNDFKLLNNEKIKDWDNCGVQVVPPKINDIFNNNNLDNYDFINNNDLDSFKSDDFYDNPYIIKPNILVDVHPGTEGNGTKFFPLTGGSGIEGTPGTEGTPMNRRNTRN